MKICWIHGFNSSQRSFAYLAEQHPYEAVLVDYDSHQPLAKSLDDVQKQLPEGDIALVGHSLGGVIAVALGHRLATEGRFPKIATISAPLGGSKAAIALLINSIRLGQLRPETPLYESMGFKFWVPEEELGGRGKDTDFALVARLQPSAIIALGGNAAKWLEFNGVVKFERVHHPQYHKRFKNDERYPLFDLLKRLTQ